MKIVAIGEKERVGIKDYCSEWYRCPGCKDILIAAGFSYCPHCGAYIEWRIK